METNFPLEENFKWIGFICNVNINKKIDIHKGTPYWIMRAIIMEPLLKKTNHKLFIYSAAKVDLKKLIVKGYYLNNNQLYPIELPIPKINYDYYFGKKEWDPKDGPSMEKLIKYTSEKSLHIYNKRDITLLSKDKYETHKLFLKTNKNLLPYTLLLDTKNIQLQKLLDKYSTLFLKPQFGNKGNKIIVIKKTNNYFSTAFYKNMKIENNLFSNIEELERYILQHTNNEQYIIQEAVDCPKINNSAFDIRVSMVHDGCYWKTIHLVRLGAANSDLSNLSQGGSILQTNQALSKNFDNKQINVILNELENNSIKLAEYLNSQYNNDIIEIAFDFIINKDGKIYIVEINTRPGLSGIPQFYNDGFLNMTAEEQDLYDNYSVPHGQYLAKFLLNKAMAI